jgi:GT2 family glycosyltransferase
MDLSVLTVTWNSSKQIIDQINSVISGCSGLSFEQLIADNGSKDGTLELVKNQFPNLKILAFDKNLGFGAANNELAKFSSGEFILLLNPDMKVEPGSLSKIVDWAKKKPKAGIISCKLLDNKGNFNRNTSPRRFPKVIDQVCVLLKLPHLFPGILNKYLMYDLDPSKAQKVDTVQGSFMLVRREIYLKLSNRLFDQRYFIWFEDVDLCREATNLGYEVWYTPVISCTDLSGMSFAQRPLVWKQKQFSKSMLQYFQKWSKWYDWIWIAIFRHFSISIAVAYDYFRGL